MSSARKTLTQLYPQLRKSIQDVRQDVFGTNPNLNAGRTGHRQARTQLKGVYYNQQYPDKLMDIAKKTIPGFMSEQEERRAQKLMLLRRRGAGPPKKGAGNSKKKGKR